MDWFCKVFVENKEFVIPMGAAITGGLFTLLGSWVATAGAHKRERKLREEEAEKHRAEEAYVCLFTLLEALSIQENLKRSIDEMFEIAETEGAGSWDPWAKVKAIVGGREDFSDVDPIATSFLFPAKKAELITDVHLVTKRAAATCAASKTYNLLRNEMQLFLEEHMKDVNFNSGTSVEARFEKEAATRARLKIGQLNSLLGQIMDNLERDCEESWQTIGEFKEAAKERFGEHFPDFTLERL